MLKKLLLVLVLLNPSLSTEEDWEPHWEDWEPHNVEYNAAIPFVMEDDDQTWPIRFKTVTPEDGDKTQDMRVYFTYHQRGAWGMLRWREEDWSATLHPCIKEGLDNRRKQLFQNVPVGRTRIWEVSWDETFTVKCNGTTVWTFQFEDGLYHCKGMYEDGEYDPLDSWKFKWNDGGITPVTYYTYLHGRRDRDEREQEEERERQEREQQEEREREEREQEEERERQEQERQEEEEKERYWTEAITVYDHVRIIGDNPLYAGPNFLPTSTRFDYYDWCLGYYSNFYGVVEDDIRDENSLWNVKLLNVSDAQCYVIEKAEGHLAGALLTWVTPHRTSYTGSDGPWWYIVGLKPRSNRITNLFAGCVKSCWNLMPENGVCSTFKIVSPDGQSAVKRLLKGESGCSGFNSNPINAIGFSKPYLLAGGEGAVWTIEEA